MGRRELLEALQREGVDRLAAISARGADAEARMRREYEERRNALLRDSELQREQLCSDRKRSVNSKASREASQIRLRAEHSLSLRLYERARASLKRLREEDADTLFAQLADELPAVPWHSIRTAPGDAAKAAARFPEATIVPDGSMAGGLEAASMDNALTVDNTLETRLERLWPDMLPHLMAELRGRRV